MWFFIRDCGLSFTGLPPIVFTDLFKVSPFGYLDLVFEFSTPWGIGISLSLASGDRTSLLLRDVFSHFILFLPLFLDVNILLYGLRRRGGQLLSTFLTEGHNGVTYGPRGDHLLTSSLVQSALDTLPLLIGHGGDLLMIQLGGETFNFCFLSSVSGASDTRSGVSMALVSFGALRSSSSTLFSDSDVVVLNNWTGLDLINNTDRRYKLST